MPAYGNECEDLRNKIKLGSQRKKAVKRLQMIKRNGNLRNDVVKTISSNICNIVPICGNTGDKCQVFG
jgi:U3 small nucleolar ribonucleoprotein component